MGKEELKKVHLEFVKNNPFKFSIATDGFTVREVAFIEKYGYWLKALTKGELAPISQEQDQFVKEMKSRKPLSECLYHVQLWKRYLRREIEEKDSKGVLKAPPAKIEDGSFYSREGAKALRKGQFKTITKAHRK